MMMKKLSDIYDIDELVNSVKIHQTRRLWCVKYRAYIHIDQNEIRIEDIDGELSDTVIEFISGFLSEVTDEKPEMWRFVNSTGLSIVGHPTVNKSNTFNLTTHSSFIKAFCALRLDDVFPPIIKIIRHGNFINKTTPDEALELRGAYQLYLKGGLTKEDLRIFYMCNIGDQGKDEMIAYKLQTKYTLEEKQKVLRLQEEISLMINKHIGPIPYEMKHLLNSINLLEEDTRRR